ncbi:MAG: hypothetical protein HYS24_08165 [Ignavibacteriales bacterium]|nr:hypothetical protein [Ignavibacteriales bacterium]MBK7981277.1 hypothetical protein [Ignavibacteriota bacterium]
MKSLINLSVMLLVVSLLTTSVFAQQANNQTRNMVKSQTLQTTTPGSNWVDADGDGICDNAGTGNQGSGKGYGVKDGSGSHVQPQDGTGYGKTNGAGNGTGVCDGTGSKGTAKRSGRK